MEQIRIQGGIPLRGKVPVSGAKNAALKLMAAALMAPGRSIIRNVPAIKDVYVMMGVLQGVGARVRWLGANVLEVDAREPLHPYPPDALVREMRASIQVMGPLLARTGKVKVSLPGGCAIGSRPVDLHLQGLRRLGAEIEESHGYIWAQARELRGADIYLDFPSVGATENLMMAAALARGVTVLRNVAREPEIVEVQRFLNAMGARVSGAGTDTIRVEGVTELKACCHTVIPDRIEAGTFMVAAALTGGDVLVEPVIPEHLEAVMAKLEEAGAECLRVGPHAVRVRRSGRLRPFVVRTQSYPGFPTDMQAQFTALATLADGVSVVTERIYSSRFKHVDELRRMGADILVDGQTAVIRGVPALTGTLVEASDLRAGAALVLAALAAQGTSWIEGIHHIDRGYERFCEKLRALGADIARVAVGGDSLLPVHRAHA